MIAGDAFEGVLNPRITNTPTPLRSGLLNDNGSERIRGLLAPLTLWIATVVIWLPWLGNVPLRDWDEGIVASVARAPPSKAVFAGFWR